MIGNFISHRLLLEQGKKKQTFSFMGHMLVIFHSHYCNEDELRAMYSYEHGQIHNYNIVKEK